MQQIHASNFVAAAEVAKIWTLQTVEEYRNLWKGIADKVASRKDCCYSIPVDTSAFHLHLFFMYPATSALANTCLDPAVAYYNYEKISIARIRQIANATGNDPDHSGNCMWIYAIAFQYSLITASNDCETGRPPLCLLLADLISGIGLLSGFRIKKP